MASEARVGVAIAAHNAGSYIGPCIAAVRASSSIVVLYDDGSSDNTVGIAKEQLPDVVVLPGTGDAWWAGGTDAAARECFRRGADYVLFLNPDVVPLPGCIPTLLKYVRQTPGAIAASLVVDDRDPQIIAWAGSWFGPLATGLPVYWSRYVAPAGAPVDRVGTTPYDVHEAHGRAVLVPREIFEAVDGLDFRNFPHYGADNDFSFRVRKAGYRIVVVPEARAQVATRNSGSAALDDASLALRLRSAWGYLTKRRGGDALRVNAKLVWRHVPWHSRPLTWAGMVSAGMAYRLLSTRQRRVLRSLRARRRSVSIFHDT